MNQSPRAPAILISTAVVGISPLASLAQDGAASGGKLDSLITLAPELYKQELRLPQFYGDPQTNDQTVDGDIVERQYLLGSWGGTRKTLADRGLFVDFGVTQTVQFAVAGDTENDVSYVGSADLYLGLDAGRAGLWPGGLLTTHVEGNWGDRLRGGGELLPLNLDEVEPGLAPSFALSEIYLTQPLSDQVIVVAGKADWAAFADTSFFANNERTQFQYTGLVNNPILGVFVPYTSWGVFGLVEATKELGLGAAVIQNAGSATVSGLNEIEAGKLTFAGAAVWNPVFAEHFPGSYQVMALYTSKNVTDFAIDRRFLFGSILGVLPVAEKDDNYGIAVTATQYLWAQHGEKNSRGDPIGFGPFFRFGISPDDRNVIDQFYSFGFGGKGGVFGRNDDEWGVGWAGSHISSTFRDLQGQIAENAGLELEDFEYAVEGFYSIAVTPAAQLTLDAQWVDPVGARKDDLIVLGTRLQLQF